MYNKDEHKQLLSKLLENSGDPGKISEILVELTKNYDEVTGFNEELTNTTAKLKDTNDSLVKANGELFQYVGLTKPGQFTNPDTVTPPIEEDPQAVEDLVMDLFQKGEL